MDVAHAYAVGKAAVELALAGHNAVMPAIERTSDNRICGSGGTLSKSNVEKVRAISSLPTVRHHPKARATARDPRRGLSPFKDGSQYVR